MIESFIEILKLTPSGGNLQPWTILVETSPAGTILKMSLDKTMDFQSQYTDHCGFGALMSLGSLAFSAKYLSADFGFEVESIQTNIDADLHKNQIKIHLKSIPKSASNRVSIFKQRFTDRRIFEDKVIPEELKKSLSVQFHESLTFFDTQKYSRPLDTIFSSLSLIRYQNKDLAQELSTELNVDPEIPTGIPIDNLGLTSGLSWLLRFRKLMAFPLPFKAAYAWPVYESITRIIRHSPEVWCLKAEGNRSEDWIQLGEKLMEVWLELTEQGLRMHPLANTLVIANYLQDPKFFDFSRSQIEEIKNMRAYALTDLKVDTALACIFFRVGYSSQPSLLTPRKSIDVHFNNATAKDKLG